MQLSIYSEAKKKKLRKPTKKTIALKKTLLFLSPNPLSIASKIKLFLPPSENMNWLYLLQLLCRQPQSPLDCEYTDILLSKSQFSQQSYLTSDCYDIFMLSLVKFLVCLGEDMQYNIEVTFKTNLSLKQLKVNFIIIIYITYILKIIYVIFQLMFYHFDFPNLNLKLKFQQLILLTCRV